MISYKLVIKKAAKKFMLKNKREGLKFYQAFMEISNDKSNCLRYDVKKLRGKENSYRLRIGKIRAIFSVFDDKLIIIIFDIGSRGDIYK